jgi:hypothetical protein
MAQTPASKGLGGPSARARAVMETVTSKRHQLHFWVGQKEYVFLKKLAAEESEPVARIVRRLIRELRIKTEGGSRS